MDIFTFELSEFIVLEESVEVEETVQREESSRFYTIDEQAVDAFEKMLPREKRVTDYQRSKLKRVIDNFRTLYDNYVDFKDTDYMLREPQRGDVFPWIHPLLKEQSVVGEPFDLNTMKESNVEAPNYYPRLIAKLPKPYTNLFSVEGGLSLTFDTPTEVVIGETRIKALPSFSSQRTIVHTDGRVSYDMIPFSGSEDKVHIIGYKLDERKLPIPNPLDGHPFFTDNKERIIYSTEPLVNILPSVDAVLMHGVPVTNDPYREAAPFLKLYDIQLSSIPWSSWKSRFPPANILDVLPPREDLEFPSRERDAPGGSIVEMYQNTYNPGIAAREWLLRQSDGGETVVKLLQSLSLEHGTTGVGELGVLPRYEPIRPEECGLLGLSFVDFSNRGMVRRSWTIKKGRSREEDQDIVNYICVPIEFIRQERARTGYVDRLTWKEGVTDKELKETQLKAIRQYRFIETPTLEPKFTSTETNKTSERHTEVLAILNDTRRTIDDKIRDTHDSIKDMILSDNVYRDQDGLFVVCKHTLAQLAGDAAKDAKLFARTWGVEEDGFVVCRFCGQRIDAVELDGQAEFDAFDRVIRQSEVLEAPIGNDPLHQESVLTKYKSMFTLEHSAHAMMFTLLTLLQVEPDTPLLDTCLKTLFTVTGKEVKNVEQKVERTRCQAAVAMTALLLQVHIPPLVPKRTFGGRAFQLNGYPRDTDKIPADKEFTIVDSLLYVLRITFEAFPASIPDLYLTFIRDVLTKPRDQRKRILEIIGSILEKPKIKVGFEPLLKAARDYKLSSPSILDTNSLISVQFPPFSFGTRKSYSRCRSAHPVLAGKQAPLLRQPIVPLDRGIQASSKRIEVQKPTSIREKPVPVNESEVGKLLKGSKPKIKFEITDDYRTNFLILSTLSMFLKRPDPTRTIDYSQHPSLLRDLSKGMLTSLLRELDAKTFEMLQNTTIGLRTLTSDLKTVEKSADMIRANERNEYIKRMGSLSDVQRQIALDLAKIGMAPIIITNTNREQFAAEEQKRVEKEEEEIYKRLNAQEEGIGAEAPQQDDDTAPSERDYGAERVREGHDVPPGAHFEDSRTDPVYT